MSYLRKGTNVQSHPFSVMHPFHRDGHDRQVLNAIVPDSNPRIFVSPSGSPAITPTKFRPDGGDRYIAHREDGIDWVKKMSRFDKLPTEDPELKQTPKPSAKRNLAAALERSEPPSATNIIHRIPPAPPATPSRAPVSQHHSLSSTTGTSPLPAIETLPVHYSHRNTNTVTATTSVNPVFRAPPSQLQRPQVSPYPVVGAGLPTGNGIINGSPTIPRPVADDTYHDAMTHRALLHNELLNDNIVDIKSDYSSQDGLRIVQGGPSGPLFRFSNKTPQKHGYPSSSFPLFSTSPLTGASQQLLKSPRKPLRKVPKNPYKVLDAPELQDDFYLNLVDWSSQNILSVGLNTCVYLWSACNSQVVKLCDLVGETDTVTSVQWAEKGDLLAVGTNRGKLQIWDAHAQKMIQSFDQHNGRIGCLAWNGDLICSGSRDRAICVRDQRVPPGDETRFTDHRQEVCGLKWSPNKQYLASGGNDNQLLVWTLNRPAPVQTYAEHNAAVKALAWSPHHHGVLVSGGGTADRCLRFWNTLTATSIQVVDTGSQVCNVAWSKHSSELVSTHGYSFNHVVLWKYPQMRSVAHLTGHSHRVLYLAMSPCGESIVTGAGDETLRFWHVFSGAKRPPPPRSPLDLCNAIR